MDKIKLPEESKALLFLMSDKSHIEPNISGEATKWLDVLEYYGFIKGTKNMQGNYIIAEITQKGKVYLIENPKLKDPSFWDDKHKLLDHLIGIIGIIKP